MKILKGSTRVVILLEDRAIRIGFFRPLRLIERLLGLAVSADRRRRHIQRFGSYRSSIKHSFMDGILGNRLEYSQYLRTHDDRLMPMRRLMWGGLIATQDRGTAVTLEEVRERFPNGWDNIGGVDTSLADLQEARQYCRYSDGTIRIVDFGKPAACELLTRTFKVA